jgi:negative regulator of sigma-B (phosphoserine phosphatase)
MTGTSEPPAVLDWVTAGRPMPGEVVSGDQAVHVARGDEDVVAVVDGLGHGPEAAEAAEAACRLVQEHAGDPIDEMLARLHQALLRTRGVVMTVASVAATGHMRWVGVGNVDAHLVRPDGPRLRIARSAVLYGGVIGYRLPRLRVGVASVQPGDVLVMATDGIAPQFVDGLRAVHRLQNLVDEVLDDCARPTDDAIVAAGRLSAGFGP